MPCPRARLLASRKVMLLSRARSFHLGCDSAEVSWDQSDTPAALGKVSFTLVECDCSSSIDVYIHLVSRGLPSRRELSLVTIAARPLAVSTVFVPS